MLGNMKFMSHVDKDTTLVGGIAREISWSILQIDISYFRTYNVYIYNAKILK